MDRKVVKLITTEDSSIEVIVGEEFAIGYHRHGSVGIDAEFEISDENIVEFVRSEAEYLYPQRLKPGITGGDAERCKWFFRAKQAGRTEIIVRDLYRFKVEKETPITVIVHQKG